MNEDDYAGQAVRIRIRHGVSHWSSQIIMAVRHDDCFQIEEQVSAPIGEFGSRRPPKDEPGNELTATVIYLFRPASRV